MSSAQYAMMHEGIKGSQVDDAPNPFKTAFEHGGRGRAARGEIAEISKDVSGLVFGWNGSSALTVAAGSALHHNHISTPARIALDDRARADIATFRFQRRGIVVPEVL